MNAEQPAEELGPSQCWTLLRRTRVARLAVVVGEGPVIFPVNIVVDHGAVVFRTSEGTKLAASVGRRVAMEADGYDRDLHRAWSVVVLGAAHEVTRLHDLVDAFTLPLRTWHPAPKPRFVRVVADQITGRRFGTDVPELPPSPQLPQAATE
jgi:uncharacterized protein